jgi:hypothetical protein
MIAIKASKPIDKIKQGDIIAVDGKKYHVDAQYVMIDHGRTKEMAIELYNDSDDDFQVRYFADQVETTLQFYELVKGVMYEQREIKKIEW